MKRVHDCQTRGFMLQNKTKWILYDIFSFTKLYQLQLSVIFHYHWYNYTPHCTYVHSI